MLYGREWCGRKRLDRVGARIPREPARRKIRNKGPKVGMNFIHLKGSKRSMWPVHCEKGDRSGR